MARKASLDAFDKIMAAAEERDEARKRQEAEERRQRAQQAAQAAQMQKQAEAQVQYSTANPLRRPVTTDRSGSTGMPLTLGAQNLQERTDRFSNIMNQAVSPNRDKTVEFAATAGAVRELASKGEKQQRQIREEWDLLKSQEDAWWQSVMDSGQNMGYFYDQYLENAGTPEAQQHRQVREHMRQLESGLAKSENEAPVASLQDSEVMYRDMVKIYSLPEDLRQQLKDYSLATKEAGGAGVKKVQSMKRTWNTEDLSAALGGQENLKQLSESYARYMNAQRAEILRAAIDKAMNQGVEIPGVSIPSTFSKAGAKNLSYLTNLIGGITGSEAALESYVAHLLGDDTGRYQTLDPNLPGYLTGQVTSQIRGAVKQDIEQALPGEVGKVAGKAISIVDSAVTSAADNLLRIFVAGGAGSLALAGLSSFQEGVRDASERGGSPTQAFLYGTANGALEVLTEKVSLDRLLSAKSPETLKELFKNAAIQGGVEVSEEELNFVGGLLADAVIMQGNSESEAAFRRHLADGMSRDEAGKAVFRDNFLEAAETAATSFLSGGLMSAGQSVGEYQQNRAYRQTSEQISNQVTQELQKELQKQNTQAAYTDLPQTDILEATIQGETVGPAQTAEQAIGEALNRYQTAGSVSNNQAARILATPAAVQYLQQNAGLELGDTASQSRNAVKAAVAQLSQNLQATIQQQAQEVQAPALQQEQAQDQEVFREEAVPAREETVSPDDSTGAAPRGFDPYTELQYETGNQRDRPDDVRPVNVPKKDFSGNTVSEFVGNAYGSALTPDNFIPVIEDMVKDGLVGNRKKSLEEAVSNATKLIHDKGLSRAMNQVARAAAHGKVSDDIVATAAIGYSIYANQNTESAQAHAADIFLDLQKMATNSARALNAFKLFRKMTPVGQMMAVDQEINQYYQDKFRRKIEKGEAQERIEIPEALKNQYQNAADDDTQDAALKAIYEYAAAQMPGTLWEKWNAWRHLSMLGNAKTHARNITGNLLFQPLVKIKNAVGAALEKALPADQRTKSILVGHDAWELVKFAMQDVKTADVQKYLEGGFKTGDTAASEIDQYRKIFKNKALETYRAKNTEWMGTEDLWFKKATYVDSLAQFLHARGITAGDVVGGNVESSVLDSARAYAVNEAMRATFNDLNAFSEFVSKRYKGDNAFGKAFNMAAEGILPYRKTPANILVRGVEYSPLSFLSTIPRDLIRLKNGKITASQFIDTLSAGLTGTGMVAFGALLSSLGILKSGKSDEDEDRQGHQTYSIEIGGKSLTIDWAAPTVMPLFMGASLYEDLHGKNGNADVSVVTAILGAMKDAAEPMLELSCLSSLNDFVQSGRYADDSSRVWAYVSSAATSYFMQALPTLWGQLDQAADKNRKVVYTDSSDPVIKELQRLAGRVFQKLPGDFYQTEYVDEWGRKQEKGNIFLRLYNSMINPSYVSDIEETGADMEVSRLKDATGENVSPDSASKTLKVKNDDGSTETLRLSADQWSTLAQTQGQTSYDMISDMVERDEYRDLSDAAKVKAMEDAYSYARELGRMAAVPDRYTEAKDTWMRELSGPDAAVDAILRRAQLSDVGASSESQYEAAQKAGFSRGEMQAMFSAVSSAREGLKGSTDAKKDYETYRTIISKASGETAEKWLSVYGMSDTRLENMRQAEKTGYTRLEYINALEASSALGSAMDKVTSAWKKGEEPDATALSAAYDALKGLSNKEQSLAKQQLSGRLSAYREARSAGMSTETFLDEYRKYYDLSNNSEMTNTEKAEAWALALDQDVQSRRITKQQRTALWDSLSFYAQVRQEAEKYHDLTASGLTPDQAAYVEKLMDGITPESGASTVKDVQKWEAVANSTLSGKAEEAALRVYMDDKQEAKLDAALSYGLSPDAFVEFYRMYADSAGYGTGRKPYLISQVAQEMNLSYALAKALVELYLR